MKRLITLGLLVISSLTSYSITIDESISRALDKNLREELKDISIGEKNVDISKKSLLPALTASTTLEKDEIGKTSKTEILFEGPLYRGGELLSDLDAKKIELVGNNLRKAVKEKEIEQSVRKTYYEGLRNKKEAEIVSSSLEYYESSYNKSKELLDLRLTTKGDFLAIKTDLSKRKLDLVVAQKELEKSKITLGELIGEQNWKDLEFQEVDEQAPKLEGELISNSEIELEKINIEIAQKEIEKSKASYRPKVDYYFGANESIENFSNTYSELQGVVGVKFSMDIFNFGKRRDEVDIAKLELEKQEAVLDEVVRAEQGKVDTLVEEIDSFEKQIIGTNEAIENLEEKLRYYEEAYSEDLVTIDELLDAEQGLYNERIILNGLAYDLRIKRYQLEILKR